MRSTLAVCTLGAFLALAGASSALAAASHDFSGKIEKVDTAAKTLVVKGTSTPVREMTFQLAPDAKITMGAKALDLATLKSGEQVKVTYTDEGTHHRAQRIDVTAPKAAAAKPASKPSAR